MAYPYFDLVQRAHSELLAEGKIAARTNQDAVEQDKGLITRRAAYYVNRDRDPSHGLLAKTSGNNSLGYSVDWIITNTDGQGWDIASDDGVNAFPSNGDAEGADPARVADWRQPTAELAQVTDGGQVDPGPPPSNTDERLSALEDAVNALIETVAQNTEATERARTQGYYGECKMGLDMHFGMKPAD
jgi:hypothetical protein